jgi:hypothetical protein
MLKHIKLFPLLSGIIIGLLGIYFIKPIQNIIYKYPTPENSGKLIYKDKNGVCYKYDSSVVDCDKNEDKLKDFPLNK